MSRSWSSSRLNSCAPNFGPGALRSTWESANHRRPYSIASLAKGINGSKQNNLAHGLLAETPNDAKSANDEDPSIKRRRVEAVLLLTGTPMAPRKLAQMSHLSDATEARTLVRSLNQTYQDLGRAIRIEMIAGGYRMLTRPSLAPWLSRLTHVPSPVRLSTPMMETLAVVAYRGPVSRAAIEAIRGVACGELLRQLMERDLVRIAGRSEDLGRPYLYDTTKRFLQLFGLPNTAALPPIDWQTLQEEPEESKDPVSQSENASTVDANSDHSSTSQKEPVVSIAVASVSPELFAQENNTVPVQILAAETGSPEADMIQANATIDPLAVDPSAVIEDEEDDLYEGVDEDADDDDWDEDDDDDWDDDDEDDDDDVDDDDEDDDDELDDDWEEVDDEDSDEESDEEEEDWDEDDDEEEDWDDDDEEVEDDEEEDEAWD
ncbi:SMC-Scp complex subunit ScpB [Rubripirellula amarantea]|nr:SMC-Scp complex subunit ScpB [Rubripirellula amarantea]